MPSDSNKPPSAVTLRAVIIALVLIPFNVFWVFQSEVVWNVIQATILSIFYNSVFCLFLLVVVNRLLLRFKPRWVLRPAELLTIYVMLNVAIALPSVDLLQILMPLLGHAFWFATPSNRWQDLFWSHLPSWLTVNDHNVLKGFYQGGVPLFASGVWQAWVVPMLAWCGFFLLIVWTTLCLSIVLRRRFSEEERLSFPTLQLPIRLTASDGKMLKNRLFWAGFAVAGALDVLHGLHVLFPLVPDLNTKTDLRLYFTQPPWSAMGWMPLAFYPFAVGLAYFMPVDLAFSCWFFYVVWKAQLVVRQLMGLTAPAGPYLSSQSAGAWLGIGLLTLWSMRRRLWEIARACVRRKTSTLPDESEPLGYPMALLGAALGLVGLGAFCFAMGMSWWVILLFWMIYLLLVLTVTRMRAELGPPTHDLYFTGPEWFMTTAFGSSALGARNLSAMSLLYWVTRDFRSHPMPFQLEALKFAEMWGDRTRKRHRIVETRKLMAAIMLAALVGFVATYWIFLDGYYRFGATARMQGMGRVGLAGEACNRLANWLNVPSGPDTASLSQLSVGVVVTALLMGLRRRFLSFPFHPVGYAVAGSWTMSWLWFSVFISWGIKLVVLRYGGIGFYRKTVPFFVGLMLGEYVVGGCWSLLGIALQRRVYGFFPF